MSQTMITLPQHIYAQYQQLAEIEDRPFEEIVSEVLDDEIDQQLWAIVNQKLSPEDDARLHDLTERNNDGLLSNKERAELEGLGKIVNQQMLKRTEALILLQQRGHDIPAYLKSWQDDENL